jgi:glycerophosphoryl diester phosphodiesterase
MIAVLNFLLILILVNAQELDGDDAIALPSGGICAHRGAMDTHPENTLSAFREAIRLGVEMIEFDVRMTADGHLVILHDATVDRTTDGQGTINTLNLEEVRKLDAGSWKSERFKGEKIPTLEETLNIMPDSIWLNVHLKGGPEIGQKTAVALLRSNRINQAFLACSNEAAAAARRVAPKILICNMDRQGSTEAYIDLTIELKSQFLQFYQAPVNARISTYTDRLKTHQIKTNYCCTDDPEEAALLFKHGVDFILVNRPDQMIRALDSMQVNYR